MQCLLVCCPCDLQAFHGISDHGHSLHHVVVEKHVLEVQNVLSRGFHAHQPPWGLVGQPVAVPAHVIVPTAAQPHGLEHPSFVFFQIHVGIPVEDLVEFYLLHHLTGGHQRVGPHLEQVVQPSVHPIVVFGVVATGLAPPLVLHHHLPHCLHPQAHASVPCRHEQRLPSAHHGHMLRPVCASVVAFPGRARFVRAGFPQVFPAEGSPSPHPPPGS